MLKFEQLKSFRTIDIENCFFERLPWKWRSSSLSSRVARYVSTTRHISTELLLSTIIVIISIFNTDSAIAADVSIELTNGDKLTGEIIERTDSAIVMQHPTLGKLTIPLDKIDRNSLAQSNDVSKGVNLPMEEVITADENTIQPLTQPIVQGLGFFDDIIFPGWRRHVGAGLAGSAGNSDSIAVNAALEAKIEDQEKRWDFSSTYFFGKTDGKTYKNRFNTLLTRDWLFSGSPWFASAHGRYEFSKFEDWAHRFGLFIGPGYQLIKTDEVSVLSRLGFGVTRTLGSENDDWSPELNLGLEGNWAINNSHRIEAKTEIFPNLGDLGEFRAITSLVWITKISNDGAFKLNLGIQNEYDSESESESGEEGKSNDFDYYARFGYDF